MRTPDYSDDQLVASIAAAAAELGEPLTAGAYDAWQRGRSDAASPALVIRRFGSWIEACTQAGVATNKTRSTSRRWSDDDVVAIVASYLRSPGSTGTFADYSAWARAQDGVPSGATLRQRFPWAEVKERASAGRGSDT
ncbi:homing endonuclease associated repeat-containing protein [Nocardioides bizhenqiangii]|uniref:Uncharacterized protein n=1 Tax=Nocardioides bizhenqiangii TaxID=3095076 RepID=A0ABZ0ZPV2_9ACTN|nr:MULTISPECIES: hypothetical protein [unclassified Nocardioides]MDZ5619652.1 hypothetical protein [Nocardioides sp. HM23]WQQ26337.1 hypothetical protein SHK19_20550 [Nocardioides sp. HM61]